MNNIDMGGIHALEQVLVRNVVIVFVIATIYKLVIFVFAIIVTCYVKRRSGIDIFKKEENVIYKNKIILYEQQLELCRKQLTERDTKNIEMLKIHHDIKNHLASILGLITNNNTEEAKVYIENLLEIQVQSKEEKVSHSGNIMVDSLINYKCAMARKEGIEVNVNVFIPVSLPFQTSQLTIVFGNLLENAIEACRHMQKGKRSVNLEVIYSKETLIVYVSNTCEGERPKDNKGWYLSTKPDKANHGLGLVAVKSAIEQYQGDIWAEYRDGLFQVALVMYGNCHAK